MLFAHARRRNGERNGLRVGLSLDLEQAAVDLVAVAKPLERQVRTDAVERAQVDAFADAEKAQLDRGLGIDFKAVRSVAGSAQREPRKADLLTVENDPGPEFLPGPLRERPGLRRRRRLGRSAEECLAAGAAREQADQRNRETANQPLSNLSDAELMQ